MSIKEKILRLTRGLAGTRIISAIKEEMLYESRRNFLMEHILHDIELGVTNEKYTDHDIIVSLTTYGRRVNDVAFTIESLMQQAVKANKIVLWLDNSFKKTRLPRALLNQQKRGLEIDYCSDIRSYKKLVPSLCKYPNDAIITVDDDLLYEYDLLERLITSYLNQPQYIHAARVHKIKLNSTGRPCPYNSWYMNYRSIGVDRLYFVTGGGGVLYPPHSLDKEVLNDVVFMDICKLADDVWFNAMALKKGTLVNKIETRDPKGDDFLLNAGVQDMGLFNVNIKGDNLNDKQLEAVFSKYNLYKKLSEYAK